MMKKDLSNFQDEMLMEIAVRMPSVEDFNNFSSVCHSWHRASYACDISKLRKNWARYQMPWLMLTDGNDDDDVDPSHLGLQIRLFSFPDDDESYFPRHYRREIRCNMNKDINSWNNGEGSSLCCQRSLLNLSRNRCKCYNLNLHEINERVCWGSQYGWVVTLGLDRKMSLFNPLTKAQLPLPPQTTFPNAWSWSKPDDTAIRNYLISKAVLLQVPRKYCHSSTINEASLCDNGNSIWLVVAIYGPRKFVAIAKPGDKAWMPVELERPLPGDEDDFEELPLFDDVLFCPNMSSLLFLDAYPFANLFFCDIHDIEHPQMLKLYLSGPLDAVEHLRYSLYLVGCLGDILIITKVYNAIEKSSGFNKYLEYKTSFFRVYKLNWLTKNWNEVQDLEDFALFLGPNASMARCAKVAGCQRNCIYFCDDLRNMYIRTRDKVGGHDMGIYNMSSGIIEPLYAGPNSRSSYCCPFWLSPSI